MPAQMIAASDVDNENPCEEDNLPKQQRVHMLCV
jgi:hypothetical protein